MPDKPVISLKGRALRFLSRRDYSRQELRKKLLSYAESEVQLEELLDDLQKNQWLSDERYAESLVRRRTERFGSKKILEEMRQNGLSDDLLNQYREDLKAHDPQLAFELWHRKFEILPTDPKEKARQIRFLVSRGFSSDLALKIVSGRLNSNDFSSG
jgi:regulatory protein